MATSISRIQDSQDADDSSEDMPGLSKSTSDEEQGHKTQTQQGRQGQVEKDDSSEDDSSDSSEMPIWIHGIFFQPSRTRTSQDAGDKDKMDNPQAADTHPQAAHRGKFEHILNKIKMENKDKMGNPHKMDDRVIKCAELRQCQSTSSGMTDSVRMINAWNQGESSTSVKVKDKMEDKDIGKMSKKMRRNRSGKREQHLRQELARCHQTK